MTDHYFENDFVKLHYYVFGEGAQPMLCFHGFGMHGKQFKSLEAALGKKYTFYGFDLFFHKQTLLHNQSLNAVKTGITKQQLAQMIADFCTYKNIGRFSVIGYSMGTHYATVVTEEMSHRIDEYIMAAPSSVNPGRLITFFSKNKFGNRLLQRLALSRKALINMLDFTRRAGFIDDVGRKILYNEIATEQLRFNFYACFTYLRFLGTDEDKLIKVLTENHIRSIFIFGRRDRMFPPAIGKSFFKKFKQAEVLVLDADHEMINTDFVNALAGLLI